MSKALPLRAASGGEVSPAPAVTPDLHELQDLLVRAHFMIDGMLERLRDGQRALQGAAVQKLQDTSAKLHEVTSATESAASDILDGLDRALALVDRLDAGEPADEITAGLRDELFGAMNHLQFQDITSQQLQHASSVLHDMELQLVEFVKAFDEASESVASLPAPAMRILPRTFDPAATVHDAERRQALVDELLGK